MKRLVDFMGSIAAILLFSPLGAVIALLVILSDSGSVIFKQKRLGQYGKEFYIYKFRTMVANAEEILKSNIDLYREYENNSFSLDGNNDPRVTKLGKFLRKTSLDEIPQFINVLKGEMSLVGPRPIIQEEIKHYKDKREDLLSVRPGITGYWQVCGRSKIRYPERVDVELYYVYNQSLWLDVKILFQTLTSVVLRKGAY